MLRNNVFSLASLCKHKHHVHISQTEGIVNLGCGTPSIPLKIFITQEAKSFRTQSYFGDNLFFQFNRETHSNLHNEIHDAYVPDVACVGAGLAEYPLHHVSCCIGSDTKIDRRLLRLLAMLNMNDLFCHEL